MSDNYPNLPRSSNKRFSEILSEGFLLFGKNWLTLIIPFGLFFIISLVIKNFILVDLEWRMQIMTPAINNILDVILEGDPNLFTNEDLNLMLRYLFLLLSINFLDVFFPTVFSVFAMCLVSNHLYNKFIDKDTKLITELKKALNGRLFLVLLLLGVIFSVGWMLFIPAILIFGFYIFYVFTYHSDDSEHPMKDALYVAKGEFWKIVGIFFIYHLIVFVFDSIYYSIIANFIEVNPLWYNPSTRDYGSIILYDFILSLIPFLLTPLLICFLTSLYAYLKARKEQTLQYKSSYPETPQRYETPRYEAASGSGMYCPFCGKYTKVKYEFCPHCREKLDFELK